jgi:hypothetical protein
MLDLAKVGAADFSNRVGDKFRLKAADNLSFDLELMEVHDTGRKSSTRTQSPFSLLFKGPRENLLVQQMYRIENGTLGAMDLFLVPVRQDQNGYYYEAVFN